MLLMSQKKKLYWSYSFSCTLIFNEIKQFWFCLYFFLPIKFQISKFLDFNNRCQSLPKERVTWWVILSWTFNIFRYFTLEVYYLTYFWFFTSINTLLVNEFLLNVTFTFQPNLTVCSSLKYESDHTCIIPLLAINY